MSPTSNAFASATEWGSKPTVGEDSRPLHAYMPRVADENKAYVMHYPHKVGEMLKKAWKLRRKIRRRQKEGQGKA